MDEDDSAAASMNNVLGYSAYGNLDVLVGGADGVEL